MDVENLSEEDLLKLEEENTQWLAKSNERDTRAQNVRVCQRFGLQGTGVGARDETRRFLTRVFVAVLNKNGFQSARGSYKNSCPKELPMNPVEWFSSRGIFLRGWPGGLKREARKGWPGYAEVALGKLFVEGRIRFLKKVDRRTIRDCGLSEKEIRQVLKDTRKHEKRLLYQVREEKLRGLENTDDQLCPIPSESVSMTRMNTELMSNCTNPDAFLKTIKFCAGYGFTNSDTQSGNTGYNEVKAFASKSIIALLADSGIKNSAGANYRITPSRFLQNPQGWLAERGYEAVGWPRNGPVGDIYSWHGHALFAFVFMLLRGTIYFQSTGSVISPVQLEKHREHVKQVVMKSVTSTFSREVRTKKKQSLSASAAKQRFGAQGHELSSESTSGASNADSSSESSDQDDSDEDADTNSGQDASTDYQPHFVTSAVHQRQLVSYEGDINSANRLSSPPIVSSRTETPQSHRQVESPRKSLASSKLSRRNGTYRTHDIKAPLVSKRGDQPTTSPRKRGREKGASTSQTSRSDARWHSNNAQPASKALILGRKGVVPLEPSLRRVSLNNKAFPNGANQRGGFRKHRYMPYTNTPFNALSSYAKARAYKTIREERSSNSLFPLPTGYTWPWKNDHI
ncbi:hypothetical protein SCHPADRAFT_928442 [Schizopora paradoxa]|uniref:Uncharacterized protein n=1 Tax=Schizopora paradoxa TaxID=27342 RepID=A0A0H2RPR6_9AGAM|nr:hypothetical protein SCHPADRAFT_928442 [Schizopora paradoxa]